MRQYLLVGNWKMNGNQTSIADLLEALTTKSVYSNVAMAVCPPHAYLGLVSERLENAEIGFGAQDCCAFAADSGAYTGDVSVAMLNDLQCDFVIVGHSERREYYAESSEAVAQKALLVQQAGICPIVCIGETLAQREAASTLTVIAEQLNALLSKPDLKLANIVIAYEPVWAIGTGKTASPEQAQEVHAFIRAWLKEHIETQAAGVKLLYGGSVKGSNAAELFAQADIDGALVGGASLKADDFWSIAECVGC